MIRLVCAILSVVVGSANPGPGWTDDYGEALSNARCDRRPMVVVIENPEKVKERAGSIFHVEREILTKFEICRVDAGSDYGQKVAELYRPSELPYTVITDADCEQIVFRGVGERTIGEWTETLEDHADEEDGSGNTSDSSKSVKAKAASGKKMAEPSAKPVRTLFSHPDLTSAQSTALSSERPLLVYLSMENCKFCDKIQLETFSDGNVVKLITDQFESIKIMKEQHADFAAQHGVSIFPTVLVFSSNGALLTKIDGYVDVADFTSRVGGLK